MLFYDESISGDSSYLTVVRSTHMDPPVIHKGNAAQYSILRDGSSGVYIKNDDTNRGVSIAYVLLKA